MDFSTLAKSIQQAATDPTAATPIQKIQLSEACNALTSAFQTPEAKLTELCFGPIKALVLRLGIDMHLFDVAAKSFKEGKTVSLQELSTETKAEALLIRRLVRILLDMNIFTEVEQDVFQPQPAVMMYMTESPFAQALIQFTNMLQQMFQLPEYFEKRGYKSPDDAYDGPFQAAIGKKLHVFDWLAENPRYQKANDVTMSLRSKLATQEKWFEIFPIETLLKDATPSETFLVDIGGGHGQNSIILKEAHSELPGKIVVQDVAPVVEGIKSLPTGIEAAAQSFFDPQPVIHAKVYFLGHILHDWPDKQAKIILKNIHDAMAPDSVLLLDEPLLPERDVPFLPAVMDLVMMNQFSSLERTEKQFKELLGDVGFELVKVWKPESKKSGQSVLEAKLRS